MILWDDGEPVIIQHRRIVKGVTAPCPPFSWSAPRLQRNAPIERPSAFAQALRLPVALGGRWRLGTIVEDEHQRLALNRSSCRQVHRWSGGDDDVVAAGLSDLHA